MAKKCWCVRYPIEDLLKHYSDTRCKDAERRLAGIGLINKTEQEEVGASSAPKQNNK